MRGSPWSASTWRAAEDLALAQLVKHGQFVYLYRMMVWIRNDMTDSMRKEEGWIMGSTGKSPNMMEEENFTSPIMTKVQVLCPNQQGAAPTSCSFSTRCFRPPSTGCCPSKWELLPVPNGRAPGRRYGRGGRGGGGRGMELAKRSTCK